MFTNPASSTVRVPPLAARPSGSAPQPTAPAPVVSPPPARPTVTPTPVVPVSRPTPPTSPPAAQPGRVLEFGQPLPQSRRPPTAPQVVAIDPNAQRIPIASSPTSVPTRQNLQLGRDLALPSGTLLSLRYSGTTDLKLQGNAPWQEVLLLEQEIRDASGKVVVPAGTPVLGRFETDRNGSRFVTQAIALPSGNIPLVAQSEPIKGHRQVLPGPMARNSGLAAVGGLLLTGSGVGLAAGGIAAAATYATAPQPATILPNQVVTVRVVQ